MRRILTAVLMPFLLSGCYLFLGEKGDKGDRGEATLTSTKIYSGTPNDNPYNVTCPELTGTANQTVDVYLTTGSTKYKMPFSNGYMSHYYSISGNTISLISRYINPPAYDYAAVALNDVAWDQGSYRIEIRTFSSAAAARAYRARNRLNKTAIDSLIYGKETN